ncbi:MAG: hypothetical protein WAK96_08485 [Desulfobaccales bacterium]
MGRRDPDHKIQVWRWRQLAAWIGAGLRSLAVMALLDGFLSRVWEPASLITLMPASGGRPHFPQYVVSSN